MPARRPAARPTPPLGPLLFECARLLDDLAQAEVNRQAGARLLTPALVRLLPHLSTEGIRPTEIARRIDVTKQAVGQALASLEAQGFVEMIPDDADGRARLVRLTPHGLEAFEHGRGVLAFFESGLRDHVGATRIEALREALDRVHVVLLEWTANGAPEQALPSVPAVARRRRGSDRSPAGATAARAGRPRRQARTSHRRR